jgi:hypothetical protein
MIIEGTEKLTHPAKLVFATLRDKTPELAAIMPNIETVQVLGREEQPPLVRLRNRWQGTNSDVPGIIRPFVKKDLLAWQDHATWDEDQLACTWKIEAVVGKDCFSCEGRTTVTADGDDRSVFNIRGELRVDPDHVPGVPRFLARKLQEPLERFIANAIRPNLTSIAAAVQRYLDDVRV